MPNILLLDIETKPCLAYVWNLWKENIGIEQIKSPSEMICWAAKWYGEAKIMYKSIFHDSKKDMLKTLHELLDKADIVVHYNGRAFDVKTINKEFIMDGINPTSRYKQVDLYKEVKDNFNFQSNRLEFICIQLGLGKKEDHEGFPLWKRCMENNKEAWDTMRKYNIQDVKLTEKLYERMKPWISNHPNLATIYGKNGACPTCLSKMIHKKGKHLARTRMYQDYQCQKCGKYFSGELVK